MLVYFSRYCTVRLKVFSLFFVFFFYVLFVRKVLATHYGTVPYSQEETQKREAEVGGILGEASGRNDI